MSEMRNVDHRSPAPNTHTTDPVLRIQAINIRGNVLLANTVRVTALSAHTQHSKVLRGGSSYNRLRSPWVPFATATATLLPPCCYPNHPPPVTLTFPLLLLFLFR